MGSHQFYIRMLIPYILEKYDLKKVFSEKQIRFAFNSFQLTQGLSYVVVPC